MHLYESNSHGMMKSFKRSRRLLCLVNLVGGWAESSYTEDGDADSPAQSASTGDDAGSTKGVSGSGPGNATGAL